MRRLLLAAALAFALVGTTAQTAEAHGIYRKVKISKLPLKAQVEIYQYNILHARYTLAWWRSRNGNWAFDGKRYPVAYHTATRDIRFHKHLLKNAARNLAAAQWKLVLSQIPHYYSWLCIHRYEGSWTDPNAPYYGGLQMDWNFMRTYGSWLLSHKGTADHWTPFEQMLVAERAHRSGRGFGPWPNTARYCHLL